MARPTLLVKFAEAGDGYLSWRWSDRLDTVHAARVAAPILAAVREGLAGSLPNPRPGETAAAAFTRAATVGGFASPDTTATLADELRQSLLPAALWDELSADLRPLVRLQPSPSLAQVPWELVLLDRADVVTAPPATVGPVAPTAPPDPNGPDPNAPDPNAPDPRLARDSDAVVAVIDPRVPGQAADSALGSVLGRPAPDSPLAALVTRYGERLRPGVGDYADLVRRSDLDRHWLHRACADAGRLLYVGHTSNASEANLPGEHSALHLCCRDSAGRHRPLTAGAILTGHQTGPWRFPPRVALLGCESGGDARDADNLGLVLAMLAGGAELVTATRWVLPTDRAFAGLGSDPSTSPLQDLVLAVDAAHADPDAIAALAQWRRERARTWQETGDPADSPLLWASITTTCRAPWTVGAPVQSGT